ncbi:peroxiredoxin family protein [Flagellimonas sp. 2504JD4-2]
MRSIFSIIAFIACTISFGQAELISKTRNITVVGGTPISSDNAYSLLTGKRLSQKELNHLLRNKPNVYVENEFDKYGKVVKYWFNPNKVMGGRPTTIGRTATGEEFPEFAFTTTKGVTMDSKNLNGKWIIIRFEGHPEDHMFKAHEIEELDQKIEAFEQVGHQVEAFDIIGWDSERANRIFTIDNSHFHIIPNGGNFHRKFKMNRTPKTLVINPDGMLMGYYNYSEDIDLAALAKQ